jgi:hypothetical protein
MSSSNVFPFAALPAELRLEVYRHLLVDPDGINFRHLDNFGPSWGLDPLATATDLGELRVTRSSSTPDQNGSLAPLRTNILSASRAINAEARDILYGQPFRFATVYMLKAFANQVGQRNLAHLRHVTIWRSFTWRPDVLLHAFRGAIRLRRLVLEEVPHIRRPGSLLDSLAVDMVKGGFEFICALAADRAAADNSSMAEALHEVCQIFSLGPNASYYVHRQLLDNEALPYHDATKQEERKYQELFREKLKHLVVSKLA